MERWNEPMLESWERETAISAILDRGLVPKPGIGLLLRTALNAQVLFFGVLDCIFLSILAAVVLMIPLLAAVLQQASPAPMLFLASPALYVPDPLLFLFHCFTALSQSIYSQFSVPSFQKRKENSIRIVSLLLRLAKRG